LKNFFSLPALAILTLIVSGCATSDDLRRVRNELDQKINVTSDSNMATVEAKLTDLKAESSAVRGEVAKNAEAVEALRKGTIEEGADIADIRENIRQVKGQLDALRKDLAATASRTGHKDDEYKEVRDKLADVAFKVNFIENFLGIGKREEFPEVSEKGEKSRDVLKGKSDKESVYAAAFELFKEGKYEKSREMFQNYLKQYPDTEYSDNAQFWIAECYYYEKKYENAILEYDKVSTNYPDGVKVPLALLKQGITLLKLGDKVTAKLVLERVIKDYPNTNQARTAKATLLKIK